MPAACALPGCVVLGWVTMRSFSGFVEPRPPAGAVPAHESAFGLEGVRPVGPVGECVRTRKARYGAMVSLRGGSRCSKPGARSGRWRSPRSPPRLPRGLARATRRYAGLRRPYPRWLELKRRPRRLGRSLRRGVGPVAAPTANTKAGFTALSAAATRRTTTVASRPGFETSSASPDSKRSGCCAVASAPARRSRSRQSRGRAGATSCPTSRVPSRPTTPNFAHRSSWRSRPLDTAPTSPTSSSLSDDVLRTGGVSRSTRSTRTTGRCGRSGRARRWSGARCGRRSAPRSACARGRGARRLGTTAGAAAGRRAGDPRAGVAGRGLEHPARRAAR